MPKNRTLVLLLLSASLLRSPAVISNNSITTASAANVFPASTQVLMISGTQAAKNRGIVQRTDDNSIHPITDAAPDTPAPGQTWDEEKLTRQRELFVQAEEAVNKRDGKTYYQLADQLKDYPLYPYLEYQWLRKHLGHDKNVKAFLEQNPSSRYASLLKRQWLYNLAKRGKWTTYMQYYSATSDTKLNCYYHRAQFKTGDKQAALKGASKLWTVGKSQPKVCDPLFAQLKKSSLYNDELKWTRFEAAMLNKNTRLAKYVKKQMSASEQKHADFWLKLYRNPERHLPELLQQPQTAQSPVMFTQAINRLAARDVYQAIKLWDDNKHLFTISDKQSNKLERRLAMKLAFENDAGAYDRLGQLDTADYNSQAWRVRVALDEQDWPRVIKAIQALNPVDQKREKWQYWLARAYQETGKPVQADELFSELASRRDYYGYLAADRLKREYQLSNKPVQASEQQIADIKNRPTFRVAYEFLMLDRLTDAKLHWWYAVRQLDKSEIPAAAKLAQQWDWSDEMAIFTIAKVKHWDDIEMRFPMSYSDKVHENAIKQNLNPVILYGLIRRESAFNKDAHSPVGARGLMQIMPATGRTIAKDLNERWKGKNSLYDPEKNLKYGSYYYHKLLTQFDGNYALALAAYNAGPNRVKKWLPDESTPADIWIETIPFKETREYVSTVLVYAMIYQQLLEADGIKLEGITRDQQLTMNDLTRVVNPSVDVALNQ